MPRLYPGVVVGTGLAPIRTWRAAVLMSVASPSTERTSIGDRILKRDTDVAEVRLVVSNADVAIGPAVDDGNVDIAGRADLGSYASRTSGAPQPCEASSKHEDSPSMVDLLRLPRAAVSPGVCQHILLISAHWSGFWNLPRYEESSMALPEPAQRAARSAATSAGTIGR